MAQLTPDDLVYTAEHRCHGCGAGLAYRRSELNPAQWRCSEVLLGTARGEDHTVLPTDWREVKSEHDADAHGETTRPKPAENTTVVPDEHLVEMDAEPPAHEDDLEETVRFRTHDDHARHE